VTHSRTLLEEYVQSAKLMQLATAGPDGVPSVCHVWYSCSFNPDRLHFVSRTDREHCRRIRNSPRVAGGIVDIELVGLGQKVRGVSFQANAFEVDGNDSATARFVRRWPAIADTIEHMSLFELRVTSWLLFDEVNFPEQPRQIVRAI